jgi:acetyl-CoA acetyltransferase
MNGAGAYIVGAFEHPTRKAPDKSIAQLHAEVANGALADAGLKREDVDGYFCSADDTSIRPTLAVHRIWHWCRTQCARSKRDIAMSR